MPCWSIHQPMSVGRSPGDHRASRYGGLLETFRYALVSWRSFWVGSLGCWWSISAIRCFRFRESSPDPRASGLPGFWRWGLRWKSHGKRRGSLLVPKGSFWIQIFDPSEDLALRWTCWLMSVLIWSWNVEVFLRFLFVWLPARFR